MRRLLPWTFPLLIALAFMPACGSSSSSAHPRMGPVQETRYLVSQRDTLDSIAKAFGTTVEWLKGRNHVDEKTLSPGQTLIVPANKAQPWREGSRR